MRRDRDFHRIQWAILTCAGLSVSFWVAVGITLYRMTHG